MFCLFNFKFELQLDINFVDLLEFLIESNQKNLMQWIYDANEGDKMLTTWKFLINQDSKFNLLHYKCVTCLCLKVNSYNSISL